MNKLPCYVTSCGRFDWLKTTMNSLRDTAGIDLDITIYDDSANPEQHEKIKDYFGGSCKLYLGEKRMGKAHALDFLTSLVKDPWYLTCEDDFEFIENGYLQEYFSVLSYSDKIIVLTCDINNDHSTNLGEIDTINGVKIRYWKPNIERNTMLYGYTDGCLQLKKRSQINLFPPLSKYRNEIDYDEKVFGNRLYKEGYRSAMLLKNYVIHLGANSTTYTTKDNTKRTWLPMEVSL